MVELDGIEPLKVQVAAHIEQRIADGTYPPRHRLPSAPRLAEEYGVSARTIADATKILKGRGLVVGVPGRGVFVAEQPDS